MGDKYLNIWTYSIISRKNVLIFKARATSMIIQLFVDFLYLHWKYLNSFEYLNISGPITFIKKIMWFAGQKYIWILLCLEKKYSFQTGIVLVSLFSTGNKLSPAFSRSRLLQQKKSVTLNGYTTENTKVGKEQQKICDEQIDFPNCIFYRPSCSTNTCVID